MILNLSEVLSEQHKTIEERIPMEMETFSFGGEQFQIVNKDIVFIKVEHVKDRELLITGKSKLTVDIPCDRCLEGVKTEILLDFAKAVDLDESNHECLEELDETNYIDGYTLDVEQLLYNEVLIGWPTKILCSEDCKGICNVCGQNLNQGACDCEDTGVDPRMSVIRDVFKNCKEV